MSARRIARVMIAFGFAFGLLALQLHQLCVVRHDEWLERSYLNRWAFRDVPTRRGSILDREGMPLCWDDPGFDLELRYWSFRREHVVGATLHGANLVTLAREGVERFSYRAPERLPAALRMLMELPATWLDGSPEPWGALGAMPYYDEDPEALARDVRFYVSSVVAGLTGDPRPRIALRLWRAARGGDPRSVFALFAEELARVRFDAVLHERLDGLLDLDRRLRAQGILDEDTDLLTLLEQRRSEWRDWMEVSARPEAERRALCDVRFWRFLAARGIAWQEWDDWRTFRRLPEDRRAALLEAYEAQLEDGSIEVFESGPAHVFRDEARPRTVGSGLDYEFASWFGLLEEHHPGFLLRPSVRRGRGSLYGHEDLGSLEPWIGRVTPFWASDGPEAVREQVDRVLASGSGRTFLAAHDALPGELEESLRRDARGVLAAHYRTFGRLGRGGVEGACDAILSGAPGLRWVEHNKRARERRMFASLDVAPGDDVRLTVDARVQRIAEEALEDVDGAHEVALVALEPQSGDVLAIVGRRQGEGLAPEPVWSQGAIWPQGTAFVGSVIKPFLVLEYLAARRRDPELPPERAFAPCEGRYLLAGRPVLHCGHAHHGGSGDPVTALAESCNVFFFEAVRHAGLDLVERGLQRVGWIAGPRWQDDVLGMRTPAGRLDRRGQRAATLAIGYGVDVAPLLVARGYAALATGTLPEVRFVADPGRPAGTPLGVPREDLELVRHGLRRCVVSGTAEDVGGLARFDLYGKTGTARVTSDRSFQNAWFACFLGTDERAALVVVAAAYRVRGSGAEVAGEMVRRFLEGLEAAGFDALLPRAS